MELPGAQSTLPYIGQLTALHLEESQELYLESEDFSSAFNLFRVPKVWAGFFAYSKKVDGRAFNRPDLGQVRPALQVVPMGWHSAVTLIQQAVRHIVYDRVGVPRSTLVQKNRELPAGKFFTVVYLDNYDEVRILEKVDKEISGDGDRPTATHLKFNEICQDLGLPLNPSKQLVRAFAGAMQGGEFEGELGVLRLAPDKLLNFITISLGLMAEAQVSEFQVRHWVGKAAFAATFRRPLFSILQDMFGLIEELKTGVKSLTRSAIDEVFGFMVLAIQAQSELKANISTTISCTDASPYGGGTAVAERFKNRSLLMPEELEPTDRCATCGSDFREMNPDRQLYPCPRSCGERFCSVRCCIQHTNEDCGRKDFFIPRFGERFRGPRFPLTKACGLAGIGLQAPLDKLIKDDPWDILAEPGKERLEKATCDASLKAEHWAPECRTFSRARGKWIELPDGAWIEGPKQVRSEEEPWGFEELLPRDGVAVRQGNVYMRRATKGVRTRKAAGGIGSMEHPYNSYVWYTQEVAEMLAEGWTLMVYSHCCFGGNRVKWTALLHNCPRLHQALHKPDCPGHWNLQPYRVTRDNTGHLLFDTGQEAEYPWAFCTAYAKALAAQLRNLTPDPLGTYPRTLESLVYSQVRGATAGLQDEVHVNRVVNVVVHTLQSMEEGQERQHLAWLMRQVGLKGTDIRLSVNSNELDRETVFPYPAFRWLWRTILAYKWQNPQHINILEVTAVLTEFRRRLRDPGFMKQRFFNIVDSLVTYYAVTKGRSSSKRLNRALRRMMALNVASKSVVLSLWTLSKWNFSDAASRRFAPRDAA